MTSSEGLNRKTMQHHLETKPCLTQDETRKVFHHKQNRQMYVKVGCVTLFDFIAAYGLFTCSHKTKHLITKPSVISKEKKHLSSVLVSNGYPNSFVKNITKTKGPTARTEPATEPKSTAVLPYIKRVLETLRRCLKQQGVRTVFKSDTTLRSH